MPYFCIYVALIQLLKYYTMKETEHSIQSYKITRTDFLLQFRPTLTWMYGWQSTATDDNKLLGAKKFTSDKCIASMSWFHTSHDQLTSQTGFFFGFVMLGVFGSVNGATFFSPSPMGFSSIFLGTGRAVNFTEHPSCSSTIYNENTTIR